MVASSLRLFGVALFLSTAISLPAFAQESPPSSDIGIMDPAASAHAFPKRGFSPYAGRHYPTRVLWGDQHVHTGWSADAGAFGATLGPDLIDQLARCDGRVGTFGFAHVAVNAFVGDHQSHDRIVGAAPPRLALRSLPPGRGRATPTARTPKPISQTPQWSHDPAARSHAPHSVSRPD